VLSEGILVARHEIEYLAPLLFRVPPIVVEMWPTRIGGAGFDLAYEVRDGHDPADLVYARAETTLVLYDFATSTPRRMDPSLRAVLTAHAGDPVPFRWRRR
jgi:acyl-CoA thioester hydrolase